ncbi:MAG TPA: PAS domain-containing protein [Vicinamibacterales bacterium]|nr:PAS domain-containing protein [Vicinamibacterales bacterium]
MMTTLQMLTLRRTAALTRLTTLQRRAERLSAPAAGVIGSALDEFAAALEEVEVATEQLQSQIEDLANARHQLAVVSERFTEFLDALPLPCVWTTAEGDIDGANAAAAELLNVSASRLAGRPLVLFMTARPAFTDALSALNEGLTRTVELAAVVRPRERRPREVRIVGRRMQNDDRRCWFFTQADAVNERG